MEIKANDLENSEKNKKNQANSEPIMKFSAGKRKKKVMMSEPRPQHLNYNKPMEQQQRGPPIPIEPEIKNGLKGTVLTLLSMPFKDIPRRIMMLQRCSQSEYINKYLDRGINADYLAFLNDHAKFGLVYGYHYFQTLMCTPAQQLQRPSQNGSNTNTASSAQPDQMDIGFSEKRTPSKEN